MLGISINAAFYLSLLLIIIYMTLSLTIGNVPYILLPILIGIFIISGLALLIMR